jgi:hypothetical protein
MRPVPGATGAQWRPPVPYVATREGLVPEPIGAFHKYRCAELR